MNAEFEYLKQELEKAYAEAHAQCEVNAASTYTSSDLATWDSGYADGLAKAVDIARKAKMDLHV